ncbi:hypothetical protein CBER1_09078 [Cercospora berteroae]|uniref:3-hydroxyisobutyrate dehydrogenase n=1 Tax=Cercospora berteroae TaxID=357750 RepID=A0A2S6C941_9PEZI|nr:hypothetical protein CBER1_09078 [Cercospora berteroae]
MAELPKSIGWIGLGLMGYPMALNLVKKMDKNTHFYVFDVVKESVEKFVAEDEGRIHACGDSKEVADESDLILSMVPEGSHVKSVYLDPSSGVIASSSIPELLIDCSTIDTASSNLVRSTLASQFPSTTFYDSPVSGGVKGAEAGTLTFMLGCSNASPDLPLLHKLLSFMGKDSSIFAAGGPSLGLTAKLCNNYCSGLIAIAVSEAMNLGIKSGMDPRVLANIFHTSTAQSSICDDWCPVPGIRPDAPASKAYEGGFRVELMKKDFGLAVEAAKEKGVQLALGEKGLGVYEGACGDEKCKGKDSRVVYRYLGGEEEWNSDGRFEEKVEMRRDETRALLKRARDLDDEGRKDVGRTEKARNIM